MLKYDLLIANDHAGFELKEKVIENLAAGGLAIKDLGTDSAISVDYPDFAKKLVAEIENNTAMVGILICGTGIGMSIAANRHSSARAALCTNAEMALFAREHNDANILVLGSRINTKKEAFAIIEKFLQAEFKGGRHVGRIAKLY